MYIHYIYAGAVFLALADLKSVAVVEVWGVGRGGGNVNCHGNDGRPHKADE